MSEDTKQIYMVALFEREDTLERMCIRNTKRHSFKGRVKDFEQDGYKLKRAWFFNDEKMFFKYRLKVDMEVLVNENRKAEIYYATHGFDTVTIDTLQCMLANVQLLKQRVYSSVNSCLRRGIDVTDELALIFHDEIEKQQNLERRGLA